MNTLKTAFFIAYRSITRGHKSTAVLLVFILSLSFLNIMFISGILSGLTNGIVQNMINTSISHIAVTPQEEPTRKDFISHQESVRAQIETIPGVVATARHYKIGATIGYDKEKNGKFTYASASVIGIDPEQEKNVLTVYKNVIDGTFIDGLKNDEIVVAATIAGGYSGQPSEKDLGGAKVGDKVQITFSNGLLRTYTIKGVFKVTVGPSANSVFVSADEAESVLSTFDNASEILVKVDPSIASLDRITQHIRNLFPSLVVKSYTERLSTIGTLISAFDIISYIVSVISIIVAAITIFVLIYVNAVNKRRQIGILKAIGIKENVIVYSYVFQSLFYAICGVGIGSILVFAILSPLMVAHPIKLPFGDAYLIYSTLEIVVSVGSLILAGILAGYMPAKIVTRENIMDAIWG